MLTVFPSPVGFYGSRTRGFGSLLECQKHATTALSFDGNQAKTGQIYITLNFRADNNSNYELFAFGGGFMRLQSGSTVVSPDDGSNMSAYDDVQPGTTNVQGSATFLIPPSANGAYTLAMLPSDANSPDITAQSVNFQLS